MSQKAPDPQGRAAAQAVQQELDRRGIPAEVILFGSRGRGDHRPDSDLDIMVVHEGPQASAEGATMHALKEHFRLYPPVLDPQILPISRDKFNYCKRAINHVAGQAWRQGVNMASENQNHDSSNETDEDGHEAYDDGYPASWPDVSQRLTAATRNLRSMNRLLQYGEEEQVTAGLLAQQAVENALKAWLSATNSAYGNIHSLTTLAELALRNTNERDTEAGAELTRLMAETTYVAEESPETAINWLTYYAVKYRYEGTSYTMSPEEAETFFGGITRATGAIAQRAHQLTGTTPEDL